MYSFYLQSLKSLLSRISSECHDSNLVDQDVFFLLGSALSVFNDTMYSIYVCKYSEKKTKLMIDRKHFENSHHQHH